MGDDFHTTHWSMVLAAAEQGTPAAEQALACLCQSYWQPLYAYLRRTGHSIHDAQDLTQAFVARLMSKSYLRSADPERGRFRSFLLIALKHFVANERKAARAQKRGGDRVTISYDFSSAEAAYRAHPVDTWTPERVFEHRWALQLLDQVLAALEAEHVAAGKGELFARLKCFLTADSRTLAYRTAADELKLNEAQVKMAVHRLRRRYRELLRAEITRTVSSPHEVEDELAQLFAVLSA